MGIILFIVIAFAALFIWAFIDVMKNPPKETPAATAEPLVTSSPVPTSEPTLTPQPTETPDPLSSLRVNTGEIVDVKKTGDVLVVKVHVNQLWNNKQTINQNWFNACEIMRSLGDMNVSELQYWAVTTNNGNDIKIISFTVPGDVVKMVSTSTPTTFADNTLGEYVTDLWILPSLNN